MQSTNEIQWINWSDEGAAWANKMTSEDNDNGIKQMNSKMSLFKLLVSYAITLESPIPEYDDSIFSKDNFSWGDLDPDKTFEHVLRLHFPDEKEIHKLSQKLAQFAYENILNIQKDNPDFILSDIFEESFE